MTKEILQAIMRTLHKEYDFDALDQVEFVMKLEREMGTRFPDDWISEEYDNQVTILFHYLIAKALKSGDKGIRTPDPMLAKHVRELWKRLQINKKQKSDD